jgi:hypothetical protein
MLSHITDRLSATAIGLWGSTLVMIIIVIGIAFWMANLLTRQITDMIGGIHRFQRGDLQHRLDASSKDEMGELASSFNSMADSVAESFQRLEEAKEKAEEASRLKSAFLANMSHELRTPLNGILGFAELIKSEASEPEAQEYAEVIVNSGSHLLNLVNEILDLSKIEAGELHFNYMDIKLATVVKEVAMTHQSTAAAKQIALSMAFADSLPDTIQSDPTRLVQILNNLLSNAVKFTDQGTISIQVSQVGHEIAFAVKDTGPGIPPEAQTEVFEKFKQLENFLTRRHEGTGLGLALVKQLVEHMGGRITLESAIGTGSTFTVYLPEKQHV